MNRIFLDTETTDLNPGQIGELSMIVEDVTTNKFLGYYNYFFKVDSVAEGAQSVHGFSVEDFDRLSGGKTFKDNIEELTQIIQGNIIAAHNEAFDEKFLSIEFWRCGISLMPGGRQCTMEAFKNILKIPAKYKKYGPYKNPKLSEVIQFLNISEAKVDEYSKKIFNYEGSKYHDSRFDTAAMYVATNVYREKLNGGTEWINLFCN